MKTDYMSHITQWWEEILQELTQAWIEHFRIWTNDESYWLFIATTTQEQVVRLLGIIDQKQLQKLREHEVRPEYQWII